MDNSSNKEKERLKTSLNKIQLKLKRKRLLS